MRGEEFREGLAREHARLDKKLAETKAEVELARERLELIEQEYAEAKSLQELGDDD
jgi:hypothetical protein